MEIESEKKTILLVIVFLLREGITVQGTFLCVIFGLNLTS